MLSSLLMRFSVATSVVMKFHVSSTQRGQLAIDRPCLSLSDTAATPVTLGLLSRDDCLPGFIAKNISKGLGHMTIAHVYNTIKMKIIEAKTRKVIRN